MGFKLFITFSLSLNLPILSKKNLLPSDLNWDQHSLVSRAGNRLLSVELGMARYDLQGIGSAMEGKLTH